MADRPILFRGPMVQAVLNGTKTQTRRALRVQPPANTVQVSVFHHPDPRPMFYAWTRDSGPVADHPTSGAEISDWPPMPCLYGQPGDRLWVRETFAKIDGQTQPWIETDYRASYTHGDRLGDTLGFKKRWTPAIHMPRAASRITLAVEAVRAERLQDISPDDCIAEGVWPAADRTLGRGHEAVAAYEAVWNGIHGANAWSANPWVWVVTFKVVRAPGLEGSR